MSQVLVAAARGSARRIVAPVAPRWYRGQMCGVRVPGLPFAGGDVPPELVLSWFYPRYRSEWRAAIRQAWQARHYVDVPLSWQDDVAYGLSTSAILAARQELCAEGFQPSEMLSSKIAMPVDDAIGTLAILWPMLQALRAADCISRYCVGWELDLWNSYASLQAIIDAIAPVVRAINRPLSVHFSTNRADWRPDHPGSTFADFWNPNVGKLTGGLWFQSNPEASDGDLQAEMVPILSRFAGNDFVSPDCGTGHPFDVVAWETTASTQFAGTCSEAEGDRKSRILLNTPAQSGPAGTVQVMGSGNGA